MKKQEKVIDWISGGNFCWNFCLYCGKQEVQQIGHDYETWYECNCKDAKLVREINDKIDTLKRQLPMKKYSIEKVNVLRKNKIF